MDRVLCVRNLAVGYGQNVVVSGLDFEVWQGELFCLIGPNGSGKTTLLKTLLRQLQPLQGTILLKSRELAQYTDKELARVCAAVLTERIDPELMECGEVVSIGRYPYTGRFGTLSDADRLKIDEAMQLVGILEIRQKLFSRLSDGQRQRAMLARALCQEPDLLVLDEPTSFLDVKHKLEFMRLLRELLAERKFTVIMSLHELELARSFADRLLCIRDGASDRIDTPDEVFSSNYIDRLFDMEEGSWESVYGRCHRVIS